MDSSRPALRELSDVGRVGRLELVFCLKGSRTVIRHAYGEVPHKITRLYYPENSSLPQLILMNSTAGLFAGDRVEIRIHVERGARVLITSQASTKVHPGTGTAEQSLYASIEAGAELHIHNDPLIPFSGARLRQRVSLEIDSGARFSFWDGFMSGRVGRGELWEFEEIDTETRLSRDEKLIYLERYRIAPSSASSSFQYVATGIFCEPSAQPMPDKFFVFSAPNVAIDEPSPGVAIARAVAATGTEYRDIQHRFLTHAFSARGEIVPDLRKY